jgi:HSP20 family protein
MHLANTGEELVFTAELPGVSFEDIDLTVHNDVLSLRVERKVSVPEGMRLHRRERRDWTLQRSFSLPVAVDAERTKAVLKDGVLNVRMAVAPEHEPKKITVSAI